MAVVRRWGIDYMNVGGGKNCGWDENFITAQNGFSRIMCNFAFIIIIIT